MNALIDFLNSYPGRGPLMFPIPLITEQLRDKNNNDNKES
jgi:hypothetical protein